MPLRIEIEGLDHIKGKFARFPMEYHKREKEALVKSLLVLHQEVPPYPPKPASSSYDRTGTLGRSLGSSEGGGQIGQPDIYEIRYGAKMSVASFGTRLHYAPKVIGEHQEEPFISIGWKNIKWIAEKSTKKIVEVWQNMANYLANWLDGR